MGLRLETRRFRRVELKSLRNRAGFALICNYCSIHVRDATQEDCIGKVI